jgi:hypothetical protein
MNLQDSHFADDVFMDLAHLGGNLNLSGASFVAGLDLSGASIAADLDLGGADKTAVWTRKDGKLGMLNLRNAHIGNLVDARDAWPGRLRLDGLTFGHLGGAKGDPNRKCAIGEQNGGTTGRDSTQTTVRRPTLTLQPSSVGDREAADDIRYLGREREREAACKETWLGSCLLQSALSYVAGYGIGAHTFNVVYWVLSFWLAGAALLWWTVPAATSRGTIWCCCASLAQLLPVIPINKELTEFFNDPERTRLKGWQVFLFSALGVIGLALGTILLVAVSGLTRNS